MSEISKKPEPQKAKGTLNLGYCLLALGLAIVELAVILALGFLTGYIPPPTPYPVPVQAGLGGEIGGEIASQIGHLANVLYVPGLLAVTVLCGSVISSKGLQLIEATRTWPLLNRSEPVRRVAGSDDS